MPTKVYSLFGQEEEANTRFKSYVLTRTSRNPVQEDQYRSTIAHLEAQLLANYKMLAECTKENPESFHKRIFDSFNSMKGALKENPHFVDAYICRETFKLIVHVKDIHCYIKEYNTTYDFGEYLIFINLNDNSVFLQSLKYFMVPKGEQKTSKRFIPNGRNHPHMIGWVCWGNAGTPISRCLADYDYPSAIELICSFLCQANILDGWGMTVLAWPVLEGPGSQQWSKENYPNMSETTWRSTISVAGSANNKDMWTCNRYKTHEYNPADVIKLFITLPAPPVVEPVAVVTETVAEAPTKPKRVSRKKKATVTDIAEVLDTVRNEVAPVSAPATPSTPAANERVVEHIAHTTEYEVYTDDDGFLIQREIAN